MIRQLAAIAWAVLVASVADATPVRAEAPSIEAPPVEAYGRLPAIEDMRLSPSGQLAAYITTEHDTRILVIGPVSGGQALQALKVGSTKVRDIRWAGEDHVLVTLTTTVNLGYFLGWQHEIASVISVNPKTHKIVSVFAGSRRVAPAVFGEYGVALVEGHWYGYFGGITVENTGNTHEITHGYTDLYRVDLDSGAVGYVAPGSEQRYNHGWLVNGAGQVLAHWEYDQSSQEWRVLAGLGGGQVLLSGKDRFGGLDLALGRTPETILVGRDTDHGDLWTEVSLTGGAPKDIADSGTIAEVLTNPWKGWIGVVREGDLPQVELLAPDADARIKNVRHAFPGLRTHIKSWNEDASRIIAFTEGGDDSGTYWLVEPATNTVQSLGSAYPDVPSNAVGSSKMIAWKAADGLEMQGVLTLPHGRAHQGLPLVVLPHGGPQARDYPGFDWWAQAFAARGYAVFQPNFRGSDGYGTEFRDAGFKQWGRKMQTDISDGVADLARQGIIDPKRACIVGASYGGYAALAGVTIQHGLYRCAVADAPVADVAGFLGYIGEQRGYYTGAFRYMDAYLGATGEYDPSLAAISPVKQAAHADAPILLIHGKDDTVVPIEQSQAMETALRNAEKPVELLVLPNEDHWLSREQTRISMLSAAVAFVEKYNPPFAAPTAVAKEP
jgi:dipeptidyl aminopeptidase/acylaminoacyl peptidase